MTATPQSADERGILIGTTELGVNVEWSYAFVGPGTQLRPVAGTIALDVGGYAVPGIIDQHGQSEDKRCTAEFVVDRPDLSAAHLLAPLWQDANRGIAVAGRTVRFRVVTHRSPDFDAIVAIEAVRRWVEDGRIPGWLERLSRFATLVDQGRFHGDANSLEPGAETRVALHECYLVTQHLAWSKGTTDSELVAIGHGLLAEFAAGPDAGRWVSVTTDGVDVVVPVVPVRDDDPLTSACAAEMKRADADFAADTDGARVERVEVPVKLPDGSVGTAKVRGIALANQPSCVLFKYLARRSGFVLIAWPWRSLGRRPEGEIQHPSGELERPDWFPRVVVSTNAETKVQATSGEGATTQKGVPCLIGLGRRLEALERLHEATTARRRSGEPRYPGGYCDNNDPWYDGRDKDHTIVDGPRVGTMLAYNTLLRQVGFRGLPSGVSLDATRLGVDSGLDGEPGQAPPPYWEPTLASAISLRVESYSRSGAGAAAQLSPDTLKSRLRTLWTELGGTGPAENLRRGTLDLTMAYGTSDTLVVSLQAISARKPVGLAEWAAAVKPQGAQADATQVGIVHEISVGEEVAGKRLLKTLEGLASAASIVVHDTVTIHDKTFVLRAENTHTEPPDWLPALVRTALAVEGLKAWQGWFRHALAVPKEGPITGLVQALAAFWLWESLWGQLEEPSDERAGKVVATLKDSAVLTALHADTRRLAARLDTVVQRLEAEKGEKASAFMNNTLFLLTGVGVAQFLQSLHNAPIVWSRDWWWVVGTPLIFITMLEAATSTLRHKIRNFLNHKTEQ